MNKLKELGFAGFFSEVLDPDNYYTKEEILLLISQIETPSYLEVNTLPATGEPNVIYLVPKQGGGKEQWIYSNGQWINIGGTDIDLTQYVKKDEVVDMMYPIGSTLIRTDNTNPETIFTGTTWQKISEGRMLIGANSTYPTGTTGGEAEVTLSEGQMPQHAHRTFPHHHITTGSQSKFLTSNNDIYVNQIQRKYTEQVTSGGVWYVMCKDAGAIGETPATSDETVQMETVGGGHPHNNMPPYLAVNIWVRTA